MIRLTKQCILVYDLIQGVANSWFREKLREQHALGEEIASAITSAPIGEAVDESELDDELAELEQEHLDNKMLKTGTVPVSDEIHRLPAAANGESKLSFGACYRLEPRTNRTNSQIHTCTDRGGRRRGRAPKITG